MNQLQLQLLLELKIKVMKKKIYVNEFGGGYFRINEFLKKRNSIE